MTSPSKQLPTLLVLEISVSNAQTETQTRLQDKHDPCHRTIGRIANASTTFTRHTETLFRTTDGGLTSGTAPP